MKEPRGNGIPCSMTYPKAKKEYRCHWCGEDIEKGEIHCHLKGHWEGDWQDWRMHKLCYEEKDEEISEGFEPFVNERTTLIPGERKSNP